MIGLSAYVIASIGSALADSMALLIVWRAVQGAAMGAGVMCARAILRDLYAPAQGARVMSKAQTGLGVIACLSAPLGGLLSDQFNWRIALLALAVFGAAALLLLAWRFEETAASKNPRALDMTLLRNWAPVLRHPRSGAFPLSGASYGGCSPFWRPRRSSSSRCWACAKQYGLLMFSMCCPISRAPCCAVSCCRAGVRRTVAIARSPHRRQQRRAGAGPAHPG
jgi:DHA1 family bicyclomycin/chloramphenicol resistance-like MFS transporter